jgi:hypothetical protein
MPQHQWSLADRESAAHAVMRLGEDDLLFLNRLIVDRLNLIAQARSTILMARFNVGDRVGFQSSAGRWTTGVVQKLNRKTVSVLTDDGHRWNVAPGLLSPARDLPTRR